MYKNNSVKDGVSVISAVKNRAESLLEVLPTWLEHPEVDEIIIVDWGSDISLEYLLNEIPDPRILIAIAPDQPKWVLSFAYNLAARFVTRISMLKLDSDIKLLPGFFKSCDLIEGEFYTGNWELARTDNERHLNGVLFCRTIDFFRINGYNEFIKSYGWDDTDLYTRLSSIGLRKRNLNPDFLLHIEHEKRTFFQDHTKFVRSLDDSERAIFNIMINYQLCSLKAPWSTNNEMMDFRFDWKNDRLVICTQRSEDKNIISKAEMEESERKAILQRLTHLKQELSPEITGLLSKNELKEYYNLIFSSKSNESDQCILGIIKKIDSLISHKPNQVP